jgi:uncharacterized protein
MNMETLLYTEHLPGGASWSARLRRGQGLRVVDASGRGNAVLGLWRADDPLERFNLPDTLKSQHIARVAAPCTLQSDMGHVLASVVSDTCGWHDVLCGCSDARRVEAKHGTTTYQDKRNARTTNARDHFLVELGRYGLGERDLVAPINLFSKVVVSDDGSLSWAPAGTSGQFLTLRFEMDVLVVLSATPHPLDPSAEWNPSDLRLEILGLSPVCPDDPCRVACPENGRAFELTERLFAGARP